MRNGLIHIYTGEGKGKTTAAIGLAVRAKSRGLNVFFAKFFKENVSTADYLYQFGIETKIFSKVKSPLFNPSVDRKTLRHEVKKALSFINNLFSKGKYDLVILDEFICLIAEGILAEDEAVEFIKNKPGSVELVLTGRGATNKIIELSHYVTNMQNIKHPYSKKIKARKGIEF